MNFGIPEEPDVENMWVSPPFSANNGLCSSLHDFESTLRCFICKEFLSIPVSLLPCHHTFCSECIRSHIKGKIRGMNRTADCPTCRVIVSGDESKYLIPNRTVETLVLQYKGLRGELATRLADASTSSSSDSSGDSKENSVQEEEQALEPKRCRTTRSTETSRLSATWTNTSSSAPQQVSERLKKKPPTLYGALKHKDIVALCEKEGLSTKGTDWELRARHEEFVKLHNAQCDSYQPKTCAELVREVARREQNRKSLSKGTQAHAAPLEQLKENRKQLGSSDAVRGIATSGDAKFDAELNAGFAKLIANARRPTRKRSWQASDDYEQSVSNVESENMVLEENEKASVAASAASMPTGDSDVREAASTVPEAPNNPYSASKTRADDKMPPKNPYSARKSSASDTSAGDTESLFFVPNKNLSNSSSAAVAAAANSARKSSHGACLGANLMDFGVVKISTSKPSSSQQTTSSVLSSQQSTSSRRSISGPWDCHNCTFRNEKNKWSRAKCELCNAQRLAPTDNIVLLDV